MTMHAPSVVRVDPLQKRRLASATNAFGLLFGLVVASLLFTWFVVRRSSSLMPLVALIVTIVAAMILTLAYFSQRIWRVNAIAHPPSCGYCPACGHQLEGLSAEADGCVICPECGAAWRVATDAPRRSEGK